MKKNFTLISKTSLSAMLFVLLGFSAKAQDTTPPVITLNTPDTVKQQIGGVYILVQPTVTDNVTASANILLTKDNGFKGAVSTNIRGWYSEDWTAEDESGNKSTKTRYIIVANFIPPTIDLHTAETVYHKIRTPYISVNPTITNSYYPADQVSLTKISSDVNENVAGTYMEVYEAVDPDGNRSRKTRFVVVGDKGQTSITALHHSGVNIYPNPAASILNIGMPVGTKGNVEIISMDGKVLVALQNMNAGNSIDVSALSNGMYTLLFNDGNKVSSARLIISH